MAPVFQSVRRAIVAAGPDIAKLSAHHVLMTRNLSVNDAQKVTLGIIVAYVVVIALLWNIPYVRWVLWPFKVSTQMVGGS
jgi:membrane protein YdbS with pleckstrin-like domain